MSGRGGGALGEGQWQEGGGAGNVAGPVGVFSSSHRQESRKEGRGKGRTGGGGG